MFNGDMQTDTDTGGMTIRPVYRGDLTIPTLYREDERSDTYTVGTSDPTLNISRKQINVFQLEHK